MNWCRITTSLGYPRNARPLFFWFPRVFILRYPVMNGRDFSQWILTYSWLGFEINLCSPKKIPLPSNYREALRKLSGELDDERRDHLSAVSDPVCEDCGELEFDCDCVEDEDWAGCIEIHTELTPESPEVNHLIGRRIVDRGLNDKGNVYLIAGVIDPGLLHRSLQDYENIGTVAEIIEVLETNDTALREYALLGSIEELTRLKAESIYENRPKEIDIPTQTGRKLRLE